MNVLARTLVAIAALAVAAPLQAGEPLDTPAEPVAVGTLRARLARPQGAAAAVGVVFARVPPDWPCSTACDYRGLALQLEAGTDGAGVAAGFASAIGHRARRGPFLSHVYVGWSVRAVAARTWDGPLGGGATATRVGVEGGYTVAGASATLAVYREVAGPDRGTWRVGGGLGWGF